MAKTDAHAEKMHMLLPRDARKMFELLRAQTSARRDEDVLRQAVRRFDSFVTEVRSGIAYQVIDGGGVSSPLLIDNFLDKASEPFTHYDLPVFESTKERIATLTSALKPAETDALFRASLRYYYRLVMITKDRFKIMASRLGGDEYQISFIGLSP